MHWVHLLSEGPEVRILSWVPESAENKGFSALFFFKTCQFFANMLAPVRITKEKCELSDFA